MLIEQKKTTVHIVNENHNFFAVPLSNHIPEDAPKALAPLAVKFCQAQSCPTKVGLSDSSTYDQDGNKADHIVFPFKVDQEIFQFYKLICLIISNMNVK